MSCERCQDDGLILHQDEDGSVTYELCSCRDQQRIREKIKSAEVPEKYARVSFGTSDGRQPRAYAIARKYIRRFGHFETKHSLYLFGDVGSGKTCLAYCVLNELLSQGVNGLAVTVPDLMDELRPHNPAKMALIKNAGILVLDDLGAEKPSEWTTETLFKIINHRYLERLPTVITSNLSLEGLEDLAEATGDLPRVTAWQRINRRIHEMAALVRMDKPHAGDGR